MVRLQSFINEHDHLHYLKVQVTNCHKVRIRLFDVLRDFTISCTAWINDAHEPEVI